MEPNYVNCRIGEKIKDLRNQNGLTQQELADRSELTKGYISQLERGQVGTFRGDTVGSHRMSGNDTV